LSGSGIEIGALHSPFLLPWGAHIKYVDRMSNRELRKQYPELEKYPLVDLDIIDDGETLEKVKSDSQDFVIASHLLEHCENPIKSIQSFLRVLKKAGILYLAVPDKRFTFDSERPITKLEHIIKEYNEGPDCSRSEHYHEWCILVDEKFRNDTSRQIEILKDSKYSIHFHVWTYWSLFELIVYLKQQLHFEFEVLEFTLAGSESIFIIKKT